MRSTRRASLHQVGVLVLTIILSGCGGAAVTASPSPTAAPTASPSATPLGPSPTPTLTPSPSPSAVSISLYLRAWTTHASIGPINAFGNVPLVISDGQLLSVPLGMGDAVPLYTAPERRSLSAAALATIVAEARTDGLLGPVTSFACPPDPSGGEVIGGPGPDYLELSVDGVTHELIATCATVQPSVAPGTPEPGTWAAFKHFRALLSDPSGWLGTEIGPAVAYDPDQLAVLVIPVEAGAPTPAPNQVVAWPLAASFATFGVPFSGAHCAVVSGGDIATLLGAARTASLDTVFRDGRGVLAQLTVRPFMPGEPDPCAG
jgi:hypothetical protein